MANVGEAKIRLRVDNKQGTSKDLQDIKKETQDMSKESGKSMEKDFTGSFVKANIILGVIKGTLGLVGKVVSGVIDGFVTLGKKVVQTFIDLSVEGGKVADVMTGFKRNFVESEEAMAQLRKASGGTINDYNLMLSANKAYMLGVTKDSTELAKLLEIARARGQALGIDTTQAFQDIVTGIGRASPLILDNLGITTQKYQEQKAALEATGVVVDDNMAKELLLASVLEDNVGPAVESTTSIVARMKTWWENLRMEIAGGVSPIFNNLANAVFPWVQKKVEDLQKAIARWWTENKDVIMPKIKTFQDALVNIKDKIDKLLNPTDKQTKAFDNMATSISGDFIDNLTDIANTIGGWIDYLIEHPDVLSDFAKDMKDFSKNVKDAVKWVNNLVDDIEDLISFYNGLQKVATVLTDISTVGTTAVIRNAIENAKGRAIGDNSFQGGWTTVGERGVELVKLPSGSRIMNNTSTRNMINNSTSKSGATINIDMKGAVISDTRTADDYAEKVGDAIISKMRMDKRSYG